MESAVEWRCPLRFTVSSNEVTARLPRKPDLQRAIPRAANSQAPGVAQRVGHGSYPSLSRLDKRLRCRTSRRTIGFVRHASRDDDDVPGINFLHNPVFPAELHFG